MFFVSYASIWKRHVALEFQTDTQQTLFVLVKEKATLKGPKNDAHKKQIQRGIVVINGLVLG